MTVGTRVDSNLGVNTTNDTSGVVVEKNTNNMGFSPFRVDGATALTTAVTMSMPGVTTLSASSGVLAVSIVDPATVPGSRWVVRSASPSAHTITLTGKFADARAGANGGTLTFAATTGTSVIFESDGNKFIVLGGSGSVSVS